jgi:hypothetical protein
MLLAGGRVFAQNLPVREAIVDRIEPLVAN